MRVLAFLLISGLLVMSGCSQAGLSSASTPEQDTQKLQGSWKLAQGTYDGETISEDVRWSFSGDQVTAEVHGARETSQFKLGVGGPRTIFVKHHDNPLAGQGWIGGTLTGIYELSGDRLRVCYDMTGRSYPKRFDASKGSRRINYGFVREK